MSCAENYEVNNTTTVAPTIGTEVVDCANMSGTVTSVLGTSTDVDCFRFATGAANCSSLAPVFSAPAGFKLDITLHCYFATIESNYSSADGDACVAAGAGTLKCTGDNDFSASGFRCPGQAAPTSAGVFVCLSMGPTCQSYALSWEM